MLVLDKSNYEFKKVDFSKLFEQKDFFMFDASGVLVTEAGAIEGAKEAVSAIQKTPHKDFKITTNDASKAPEILLERFKNFGFPVSKENIVSSGMLVKDYFIDNDLQDAKTIVLGPEASLGYMNGTGADIIEFSKDSIPEIVVILNQSFSQDLIISINILLNSITNSINAGNTPTVLLANPDLNFPSGEGEISLAPGSIAKVIDCNIKNNFPGRNAINMVGLGKPFLPIFEKALGDRDREQAVFLAINLVLIF